MNARWPLRKGLTSSKIKQRGTCILSCNTAMTLYLNITLLKGLSISKAAPSSSRNLPLFEMCKTAAENWLVTPQAVTLTLLQSQTAFSERPFLTFGFVEAFCFVFLFVCFFQNDQGSSEHPARGAALPWACVGSSDEDSVHSTLVALLLQANITSADPC